MTGSVRAMVLRIPTLNNRRMMLIIRCIVVKQTPAFGTALNHGMPKRTVISGKASRSL